MQARKKRFLEPDGPGRALKVNRMEKSVAKAIALPPLNSQSSKLCQSSYLVLRSSRCSTDYLKHHQCLFGSAPYPPLVARIKADHRARQTVAIRRKNHHLITLHLSIFPPSPSPATLSLCFLPKHFQNLRVSSPAPVTTVCPSGLMARYKTR